MNTVNYDLYKRGYPLDDGKIVFYDANDDKLKDWKFKDYERDDLIADLGEQWRPKKGMQINDECSCNHGSAGYMFRKNLKNTNISASDMLLHYIKLFLSKK
ncbi:hypothetical protein [Tenacibaculum ovolyticum]|uniref:hypothetical protein n=1 Tax=Tenacibaculum ovolyticum TaxID=104270 RepID=UPI001F2A12A6|nr:hypothetical protein [Tenacibaculum ovolyticum]